jgi:hypothetical protein
MFIKSGLEPKLVMPGFMPGIHVLDGTSARRTWMAGTSPAMTQNAACFSAQTSNDRVVQIIPFWIVFQYQPYLPFAGPMLDIVLALDRGLNRFIMFEVDEALDGIFFGKSGDQSISVLVDSSNKIVRHPDVQDAIWCARHDVNVAAKHKPIVKNVDGRDKPGHDGERGC